jgi:hypothetical protein
MSKIPCSKELEDILQKRDMPAYPDAAKSAGVGYTDYLTGAHSHVFSADTKTAKYVYAPSVTASAR